MILHSGKRVRLSSVICIEFQATGSVKLFQPLHTRRQGRSCAVEWPLMALKISLSTSLGRLSIVLVWRLVEAILTWAVGVTRDVEEVLRSSSLVFKRLR